MDIPLDIALRNELDARRGDWPQIAKAAEVSHSWVSQFVRGKIPNPGYATLLKIQGVLREQAAPPVPEQATSQPAQAEG